VLPGGALLLIGDPVPAAAVEAKKGAAWTRRSWFENLLDLRRQGGKIVLPSVLDLLLLGIIAGVIREADGKDVPGVGLSEFEVDRRLLRVQAGRKKSVAHHKLVRVNSGVAPIQQAGAFALDGESVEQIFAEGVETLVLIRCEDKLRRGGSVTKLVQHVFGVGPVEPLGDSVER